MTVKIVRVECSNCLRHDSDVGLFARAEAEYRAGIMCENVKGDCEREDCDLANFTVSLDSEEIPATSLRYFREG